MHHQFQPVTYKVLSTVYTIPLEITHNWFSNVPTSAHLPDNVMDIDNFVHQPDQSDPPAKATVKLGRTGKPKRFRTNFTGNQLNELENLFKKTQYLTHSARIEMSKKLNLNELQVKIWFQNRRMKEKREKMKSSNAKVANNRPNSPSHSLSSGPSSPSSQRSQSPHSDVSQLSIQEIRNNLLQYRNFECIGHEPEPEPQPQQVHQAQQYNAYRPVYENYIAPNQMPIIEENTTQQPNSATFGEFEFDENFVRSFLADNFNYQSELSSNESNLPLNHFDDEFDIDRLLGL